MKKYLAFFFILLTFGTAQAQWQVPVGQIPVGKGPGKVGFGTILGSGGTGAKCLLDTVPPSFGSCGGSATGVTSIDGGTGALIFDSTLQRTSQTLGVVTGTSGNSIPKLNGANTWSSFQVFSSNFRAGSGSGQATSYLNGGSSGPSDGGSLWFQNSGVTNAAIGSRSSILGSGYDPSLLIYSTGGIYLQAPGLGSCTGLGTTGTGQLYCPGGGGGGGSGILTTNNTWTGTNNFQNRLFINWTSTAGNNSPFTINHTDAATDYTMNVTRNVTRTTSGGSFAMSSTTNLNSDFDGFEYGISSTVRQNVSASYPGILSAIRVGVNGDAQRAFGTTGGDFFGGNFAANDYSASSTGTFIGTEFDVRGPGGNTDPNSRVGVSIFAERQDLGTGGRFTGGNALLITASAGGVSEWNLGIKFDQNIKSAAIDTTSATIATSRAIRIARGQTIELDPRAYIRFNNATAKFVINIDGVDYNFP